MNETPPGPSKRMRVFPERAALVLFALAIAGSSIAVVIQGHGTKGGEVPFGPLGTPNGRLEICTPTKTGIAYDGIIPLQNDKEGPITLDAIRLIDPDGLTLQAAYVLPIFGNNLMGDAPPKDDSLQWLNRVRLQGAVIPGGDERNLVLVLSIGRRSTGTATNTEILYRDTRGRGRRFLTTEAIRVARGDCKNYTSVVGF